MKVVIILVIAVAMVTTFFSSGTEAGVIPEKEFPCNSDHCLQLKDSLKELLQNGLEEQSQYVVEVVECLRNAKNEEKAICLNQASHLVAFVFLEMVNE